MQLNLCFSFRAVCDAQSSKMTDSQGKMKFSTLSLKRHFSKNFNNKGWSRKIFWLINLTRIWHSWSNLINPPLTYFEKYSQEILRMFKGNSNFESTKAKKQQTQVFPIWPCLFNLPKNLTNFFHFRFYSNSTNLSLAFKTNFPTGFLHKWLKLHWNGLHFKVCNCLIFSSEATFVLR